MTAAHFFMEFIHSVGISLFLIALMEAQKSLIVSLRPQNDQ